MVRVNLLPDRRARGGRGASASGGPAWLWVVVGLALLEVASFALVHALSRRQLAAVEDENRKTRAEIDVIRQETADHPEVRAKLDECRARDEAIAKLQAARTGPTAALLELAKVLTPGRGPTVDPVKLEHLRDNPTAAARPTWDPRRLWLTAYSESDRTVKLTGLARDGEDVSELERRLALSDYFYDVKLLPGSKVTDPESKLELVKFELAAKVRY